MDIESILKKALKMEMDAIEEYTKMKKNADTETAELLDLSNCQLSFPSLQSKKKR